jgi:hypothetical protein
VAKKAEKTVVDLVDKDNGSPLFIERDRSTSFLPVEPSLFALAKNAVFLVVFHWC